MNERQRLIATIMAEQGYESPGAIFGELYREHGWAWSQRGDAGIRNTMHAMEQRGWVRLRGIGPGYWDHFALTDRGRAELAAS